MGGVLGGRSEGKGGINGGGLWKSEGVGTKGSFWMLAVFTGIKSTRDFLPFNRSEMFSCCSVEVLL